MNIFLFITVPVTAIIPFAQSVCVYNDAGFVLHWHLHDTTHNTNSIETDSYPVWQTRCIPVLKAGNNITTGTSVKPVITAVWGKENIPNEYVLYDMINTTQITYVCRGTTLNYDCIQGIPPPTALNITKDIGEFFLGFIDELGIKTGFSKCIIDINSIYSDIVAIVDFFEYGINHRTLPEIIKAFKLFGKMLKDFGTAIIECIKDGTIIGSKIANLAKILMENPLNIIKIIIDEAVHIFHERKEITDDCKNTVSHWRAGDYNGAGIAVGDIVGIIIDVIN